MVTRTGYENQITPNTLDWVNIVSNFGSGKLYSDKLQP
jgi:hypothetical protein